MKIRLFNYVINIQKSFKEDKRIELHNMSMYKDGYYWYLTCEKLGLKRVCLLTPDRKDATEVAKDILQNELLSCNRIFAAFFRDIDTFNMTESKIDPFNMTDSK